jgi:hypothetical protein
VFALAFLPMPYIPFVLAYVQSIERDSTGGFPSIEIERFERFEHLNFPSIERFRTRLFETETGQKSRFLSPFLPRN